MHHWKLKSSMTWALGHLSPNRAVTGGGRLSRWGQAVGHSSKILQIARFHSNVLERLRARYLPYGDLEDWLRLSYLNARELEEKEKVIIGRGTLMLFYSFASSRDAPSKTCRRDLIESS